MNLEYDFRALFDQVDGNERTLEYFVKGVSEKHHELEVIKAEINDFPKRQGRMRKIHRRLEAYISVVDTLYHFVVNNVLEEINQKRMNAILEYDLSRCAEKRATLLEVLNTERS